MSSVSRFGPHGEEVTTVKYEKPEVIQLGPTVQAVRGSMSKTPVVLETDQALETAAAYEADE